MTKHFFSNQFVRFLFAGGIAACVNFSVGYSLEGLLPLHGDIVVGYLSGMVVAFLLFEKHVFDRVDRSRVKSGLVFTFINGLALIQTWLVYVVLNQHVFPSAHFTFYPNLIARSIAIITPIFTSFLGHKYFTFRH